jgi:hypothetical protein
LENERDAIKEIAKVINPTSGGEYIEEANFPEFIQKLEEKFTINGKEFEEYLKEKERGR